MTLFMPGATHRRNSRRPQQFSRVFIFGKGHWGLALGSCLRENHLVTQFLDLPDISRPWEKEMQPGDLVILVTPFSAVSSLLNRLAPLKTLGGVVNASKGIDRESLSSFSQMAKSKLRVPFGSLSGPTFAAELREKKPTACVMASRNKKWAQSVAKLISTPYFRVYVHSDPLGVEVCGAVKNIMAMGAGLSDALGLGYNARAALLSRGLVEMMAIVKKLGGKPSTVMGLPGVGDLWLTATGPLSRNRRCGELLAERIPLEEIKRQIGETVEGLYTLQQVESLRRKRKLSLPICQEIYQVAFKMADPHECIRRLMTRELKEEEFSRLKVQ